tara:strand:- start:45 stop:713 length:669 start_codon:yes stop_codon:yes gene_type:complete
MANGNTIYSGPSKLNGQPIKSVITGTKTKSANVKTGDMAQMWIMAANERPTDAAKSGADASVCGECPHRPLLAKTNGVAPCYVNLGQAPNGVYKSEYSDGMPTIKKPLRLGAYGEPTALPFELVQDAVNNADGHTGYTHQWRTCDQRFKTLLMASVDSIGEQIEAQAQGWRTFRVRNTSDATQSNEISCPASKEAGFRTQCADCRLCAGTSRNAKNIVINAH